MPRGSRAGRLVLAELLQARGHLVWIAFDDDAAAVSLEATEWSSDATLRVRASAQPDTEPGYETWIEYHLGRGMKEAR